MRLIFKMWYLSVLLIMTSNAFDVIAQEASEAQDTELEQAPPENIEALSTKLEELLEFHGIPGLSVAIVENDTIVMSQGLGLANIESNTPADQNTLFRIGSISKMFVGLAALKLEHEGKLDLQAPIKKLIPEIEFTNKYSNTDPVRVIHLLQHTSGWDDIHLREYANNDPTPLSLKDGLDYHPHSRVSRWRPGERMSYSNSGPPVVAYIVQKITGMDFEQYIEDNFFNPLNMSTATYRLPQTNATTLYVNKKPVDYWHIIMRPSGSINASALDMANYLLFLVNSGTFNGEEVLPISSIRKMENASTSLATKAGMTHGYGLTNYTSFYESHQFHGHDGGVEGGAARLVYSPELQAGFAFAVNTNSPGMSDIFDTIAEYITRDLEAAELPAAIELSNNTVEQYSGYYMPINPRQEMMRFSEQITGVRTLELSNNSAILSVDNHYVPVSEKLLRLDERTEASVALLQDDQGLAIQVGNQYLRKISPLRHYTQQGFMWAFAALLVFHFFWFFWWMGRKLLGKITASSAIQVRLWPFLASLSIYILLGANIIALSIDVLGMLGSVSAASISMMVSSYFFAIFTCIAVFQNIRYFKEEINWFTRSVCLLSCFVYSVVTIYFAYFGVIGIQTYA